LLAETLPSVLVTGEISDLRPSAAGHLYFNLKDSQASLHAVLFEREARRLRFQPANGQAVLAFGRIGLYVARGDFQIIVESLEEAGEGSLRRDYERLKARLAAEGLFAPGRKRPLPALPRRIGIVTSPNGAALRDVLKVLARRMPLIPLLIAPAQVQGEGAEATLVRALEAITQGGRVDVVIVTRGGGSLKDLAPFNTESLARAIAAAPVPVVTGIGHETDLTLSDLASDLNGITPSGAAERVSPDAAELAEHLFDLGRRLGHHHPGHQVTEQAQRLDEAISRLDRALGGLWRRSRQRLAVLRAELRTTDPKTRLDGIDRELVHWRARLTASHPLGPAESAFDALARRLVPPLVTTFAKARHRLELDQRSLTALDPRASLRRGFALVEDAWGRLVTGPVGLTPGDRLSILWQEGTAWTRIETLDPPDPTRDPD
jgi:exodeoxyribonuclease VII large subunit